MPVWSWMVAFCHRIVCSMDLECCLLKAYIKNIAYYLPEKTEENPAGRLRKKTGIKCRHICSDEEVASDLAVRAAERLFSQGISRDEVEYLVFCTQSPDYYLPTTACILQHRLGLKTGIGAFDYNLGCSGYVYGLGMAKGLIESGQVKNVLLLTAETYSKYINPEDNSVRPLFGDAATATLLTAVDTDMEGIYGLTYGTDASGADNLIVPVGGARQPFSKSSEHLMCDEYGNKRSNYNLYMDGSSIMNFSLDKVPAILENILAKAACSRNNIDYFVFHQANKFMLDFLQDKCALSGYPYWNDVKEYGNTVSNSIPIALADLLASKKSSELQRVVIIGFGVGLSWAGGIIDLSFAQ